MGANYTIRLTSGDITGANYTIYYFPATTTNIATLLSNNSPATNITLAQLLIGVDVSVPDQSSKIIVSGDGYCEDSIEFPITPINTVIPPVLCLFFEGEFGSINVQLNPYGIVNGKNAWRDVDNVYNLYYDNSVVPAKWTIDLIKDIFLSNTTDEIPLSGWYSVGSGQYLNPSITSGVCPEICNFAIILDIENTNYNNCSGIITVTVQNGSPPFLYSLDGGNYQLSNIFTNVCQGPHTVSVKDDLNCEVVANTIVEVNPIPSSYVLRLRPNLRTISNSTTTLVTQNEWDIVVEPALDAGKTIKFDLTIPEIGVLSTPGTGVITKTITTKKNNTLLPSINTITSTTGQRTDCGTALLTKISGESYSYTNISMTVGDTLTGITLSTLNFPPGSGQVYQTCRTKLNHDINYQISNLSITQGMGTFTITTANPNGVLIDVEKTVDEATPVTSLSYYSAVTKSCETEPGNPFTITRTITNLSSPAVLYYDNNTNRLWVGDLDNVNGNVYYYSSLTSNVITVPTGSPQSNLLPSVIGNQYKCFYVSAFDETYRRFYFCGPIMSGLTVYNIDTNTTQTVNTGTIQADSSRNILVVTNTNVYQTDKNIGGVGQGGYQIFRRNNLAIQTPFLFTNDTGGHFNSGLPFSSFIGIFSANTEYLWVYAGNGGTRFDSVPNPLKGQSIGLYSTNFNFIRDIPLTGTGITPPTFWNDSAEGGSGRRRYWQNAFFDKDKKRFYLGDVGSNMVYIINTDNSTIITTRRITGLNNKTNTLFNWQIDPITNKLYELHILANASNDITPQYITYEVDRNTHQYVTFYLNVSTSSLIKVGGVSSTIRASANGGLVRYQGGSWNTDGVITFFNDVATSTNTGYVIVNTIQKYNSLTNLPEGSPVANTPGQPGYIPKYIDLVQCPINNTLTAPSPLITQLTGFTSPTTTTHFFELSLSGNVVNNQTINSIDVSFVINGVTASTTNIVRPNIKGFLSGSYTRVNATILPYNITVRYKDINNNILATFPNLT